MGYLINALGVVLGFFSEFPHPTLGARGVATSVIKLERYMSFYLSEVKDLTTLWNGIVFLYIEASCRSKEGL